MVATSNADAEQAQPSAAAAQAQEQSSVADARAPDLTQISAMTATAGSQVQGTARSTEPGFLPPFANEENKALNREVHVRAATLSLLTVFISPHD